MQCEARLDAVAKEKGMYSCGRKEGKSEGIKAVAKSLLDVLDIPTIAAKTGLTEEEIRRLKKLFTGWNEDEMAYSDCFFILIVL